ncbi:MAG: hypothetical protein ABS76_19360 [Pelagibacterium sp. SCN 64-44]|nr:MAG: hypothetical protein ABS76_19360 [Pelagibacterium sp. SCN 64-44]
MDEIVFDSRQYREALERGQAERQEQPAAKAVRYEIETGRIVVDFDNGASFMVPAALLQGLGEANPQDLAQVELLGETGLHWPTLDIDLSIAGLMRGIFGTSRFMAGQRRGGQSRSPAKAEAARRNGQRGGRPRKSS